MNNRHSRKFAHRNNVKQAIRENVYLRKLILGIGVRENLYPRNFLPLKYIDSKINTRNDTGALLSKFKTII